jgi:hypothetical protein
VWNSLLEFTPHGLSIHAHLRLDSIVLHRIRKDQRNVPHHLLRVGDEARLESSRDFENVHRPLDDLVVVARLRFEHLVAEEVGVGFGEEGVDEDCDRLLESTVRCDFASFVCIPLVSVLSEDTEDSGTYQRRRRVPLSWFASLVGLREEETSQRVHWSCAS